MKILRAKILAVSAMIMLAQATMHAQIKEIIAYYPEWGGRDHRYCVKDVEKTGAADKITALAYAFCLPGQDSSGNIVPMFMNPVAAYQQVYSADLSIDGVADDSTQALRGQFNQLKKLKARHPQLKVFISIGGWGGSKYFSDAALTPESREKFTEAVIDRYILGNLPVEDRAGGIGAAAGIFDGIDIDWEYPLSGGDEGVHHNENDKDNLTELFRLFRKKLDAIDPKLILTAAVPASDKLARNYNMNKDQQYLSWYHLMTYDFCGSWDKRSGHHTNLFSTAWQTQDEGMRESLDYAVRYFRDTLGVRSDKLVPGAAFYGKGWITQDSVNGGLYRQGIAAAGIYEAGNNYFADLACFTSKGYNYHWDNVAMAPSLFAPQDKIFWTMDDEKSVALKSRYAEAYGLRGIMFWEISGDDSTGSLVSAIYRGNMQDTDISKVKRGEILKSISITAPTESQGLIEGSSLVIRTDAADMAEIPGKVEFFVDGKSIGYDTRAPFSWVWFNIPAGKHEMKAVATLGAGSKVTSRTVVLDVQQGVK